MMTFYSSLPQLSAQVRLIIASLVVAVLLPAVARAGVTTTTSTTSMAAGGTYAVSISSDFTPAAGNTYTIQLSDAVGNFNLPIAIGTLSSTATSAGINIDIPVNTPAGSGYRIRAATSNPSSAGPDNGTDIVMTGPDIITTPPYSSTLYTGCTYIMSYAASNLSFSAGNVLTVQLSNGVGGFSSPVTIGTLTSSATSDYLSITLPASTGSGYKIRTVSSMPAVAGTPVSISYIANPSIGMSYSTPTALTAGGTYSMSTLNAGYPAASGNVYTLQLSDATGSFSSPTVLSSITSQSTVASFSGTLPLATPGGTGYRVRVLGSKPAVTGSQSAAITVTPADITTTPPSISTLYAGCNYSVSYASSNISFAAGNVFTVQLSSSSGSFSSPATIGTLTSNATSDYLSITLPASTGSGYKIRTVSSMPAFAGTPVSLSYIAAPSIGMSYSTPTALTAGGTYSMSTLYAGYPATFGNVYTLQLSDATGSFSSPTVLGSYSSQSSSATFIGTLPLATPAGTGYRVRVLGSKPAVTGSQSPAITISVPTITITPGTRLSAGNTYAVPYTTSNLTPTGGNVYTLQLSDAAGSFTSPTAIGTLGSTATSGSISALVPATITPGSSYRMRVLSSNPAFTGAANGTDLTIALQNSLAFDGTDDYIALPATNNLPTGNSPYTLEAWIKPTAMGDYGIIGWGPWGYSRQVNALRLHAGGIDNYWWGKDLLVTTASLVGAWHHVAATFNGTTRTIYLDGEVAGSDAPGANQHNVTSATNGRIGCTADIEFFPGSIDEVRVWNRALCQSELQNNMNGELPAPAAQAGLVAYYKMNQGTPGNPNTGLTTVVDASASGSSATLSGFNLTGTASNYVTGPATVADDAIQYAPAAPATASESLSRTISGNTSFTGCGPLVAVTPAGAAPVSGSVTVQMTYDAGVPTYNSHAYVQRHYDINPAVNAANATAQITLYYTQADFVAYNAANGSDQDLPATTSNIDADIANLRIAQYHGTGTTPGTYTGSLVVITPTSTLYQNGRWEVTFPVTGFSGFFATSSTAVPLPVKLLSFTAASDGSRNRMDWKMGKEPDGTTFALTRSTNGTSFEALGNRTGNHAGEYTFYDEQPLNGANYYRLAIKEPGATVTYSNIAVVRTNAANGSVTVAPLPARNLLTISNTEAALNGQTATVQDMQGREVYRFTISTSEKVDICSWAPGIYLLRLPAGGVLKVVKE